MGIETILNDPNELDGGLSGLADSKEDTEGGLAAQSYANGLITAVIVGPEEVSPAEWIARIVDLTDINIDGENAKAAVAAMLSEHRKIVASLMSSRNGYEPFFWQDSERRLVTRDWAEGFLAGIRLRAEAWKPLREGDGRVLTALLSALLQDAKIDAKMVEVGVDPKGAVRGSQSHAARSDPVPLRHAGGTAFRSGRRAEDLAATIHARADRARYTRSAA